MRALKCPVAVCSLGSHAGGDGVCKLRIVVCSPGLRCPCSFSQVGTRWHLVCCGCHCHACGCVPRFPTVAGGGGGGGAATGRQRVAGFGQNCWGLAAAVCGAWLWAAARWDGRPCVASVRYSAREGAYARTHPPSSLLAEGVSWLCNRSRCSALGLHMSDNAFPLSVEPKPDPVHLRCA